MLLYEKLGNEKNRTKRNGCGVWALLNYSPCTDDSKAIGRNGDLIDQYRRDKFDFTRVLHSAVLLFLLPVHD